MKTNTATRRACAHIKDDGQQCGAGAMKNSRFCFFHDPEKEAERAAARRRGGKARHGQPSTNAIQQPESAALDTPGAMLAALEYAYREAMHLDQSPAKADAIAGIVAAAAKVYEVGALAARIEALEKRHKNGVHATGKNG